jgi:predicted membrane protein
MQFIQRIMYGRYGTDQLTLFLWAVYVLLYLIATLTHVIFLSWIGTAFILIGFFRIMSRNIEKRREENMKFLQLTKPITNWFHMHRTIRKDRDHRYYKCPNCSQYLRVPRGKGKITITCRACGTAFQEKS